MNDRRLLLFGIPLVSVLMLLPEAHYAFRSIPYFLVSWSISLSYTLTIWLGTRAIWQRLCYLFPLVDQTAKRLWLLAASSLIYSSLATISITVLLTLLLPLDAFGVLSVERLFIRF